MLRSIHVAHITTRLGNESFVLRALLWVQQSARKVGAEVLLDAVHEGIGDGG